MRAVTRVLIAGVLALGTGCARTDWIDRTLVTENVTGSWKGGVEGGGWSSEIFFELEQQGSKVTGSMRFSTPVDQGRAKSGPIEGTVAGDVFRFSQTNGSVEGEMTVSGDEMNGRATILGSRPISLRRVDSSSRPGSPPR